MRRWAAGAATGGRALAGALALVALTAAPASAHGLGGRADLPVPLWLFAWGAGAVVVVSFVALGVLWKDARLEGSEGRRRLPAQPLLTSPLVEWVVRVLALATFLVVLASAAAGHPSTTENLAPVFVYVWFWVGLAVSHALLGNLWATLSPWDTLARLLGIGERPRRPYPLAWGVWPAALVLLGFVWLELVYPAGASPRTLAVAIAGYTALTLGGMALFGREAWQRGGEGFAVYFDLLGRISPLTRDARGRVVLRPVLGGLPGLAPRPGLVALVVVLIGSTTFDGISGSTAWETSLGRLSPAGQVLAGTAGLLAAVALVGAVYSLAMTVAATVTRVPWHPLAVRFAHSLVPIALAYAVAHYFSLLVLEGQLGIRLASDPLGVGWNLFGTADLRVNLALVSPLVVWYVQVASIVAGHVGGVVLAHDRSIAAFPGTVALRSQYALLAVMVLFTVGGLVILSGG